MSAPGLQVLLLLDRLAKEWAISSLYSRIGQAGLRVPLLDPGLNRN